MKSDLIHTSLGPLIATWTVVEGTTTLEQITTVNGHIVNESLVDEFMDEFIQAVHDCDEADHPIVFDEEDQEIRLDIPEAMPEVH